jgi:glycosyltransferase 2 family protein
MSIDRAVPPFVQDPFREMMRQSPILGFPRLVEWCPDDISSCTGGFVLPDNSEGRSQGPFDTAQYVPVLANERAEAPIAAVLVAPDSSLVIVGDRLAAAGRWLLATRAKWLNWLVYLFSAAAFGYVLSNLRWSELSRDISGLVWWPIVLAIVLGITPRVLQAIRWKYLLRPVHARFHWLLESIYVATLANGVLPLSPGDLIRGMMVARRTRSTAVRVLSSEALERVSDGAALVLLVWFATRGITVPSGLQMGLLALEVGVGIALVAGLVLSLQHTRLRDVVSRMAPRRRAMRWLRSASLDALAGTGGIKAWVMPASIFTGLAIYILQAVTLWLLLIAYHINLSPLQGGALFAIITLGTALPNAPANIGSWQFFCVLGLRLFGVPVAQAAGFSLVAFVIWTIPPVLMGGIALFFSPLSWKEIRKGSGARATSASLEPAGAAVPDQ